jgi:DNA-directed RNA polymerase specialized sigma24 family protein
MDTAPKWRFVDRTTGSPFSLRYHQAIHNLSRALWQSYSYVRDEADRDNAEEETLRRVAGYEQEHGEAENLPALIRRIFPRVASSMFVRKPHPARHEESKERQNLEALGFALQHNSEFLDRHIYARELIRGLDKREHDVVTLWSQSFTAKEIARKVGMTEDNVHQIIHRIKEHLKKAQ